MKTCDVTVIEKSNGTHTVEVHYDGQIQWAVYGCDIPDLEAFKKNFTYYDQQGELLFPLFTVIVPNESWERRDKLNSN